MTFCLAKLVSGFQSWKEDVKEIEHKKYLNKFLVGLNGGDFELIFANTFITKLIQFIIKCPKFWKIHDISFGKASFLRCVFLSFWINF